MCIKKCVIARAFGRVHLANLPAQVFPEQEHSKNWQNHKVRIYSKNTTSPEGEGVGEAQFRRLEIKISTLCTLWAKLFGCWWKISLCAVNSMVKRRTNLGKHKHLRIRAHTCPLRELWGRKTHPEQEENKKYFPPNRNQRRTAR